MIVLVSITSDDIASGCHEAYNCPAHLAITRLLKPQYTALVCHALIDIQLREGLAKTQLTLVPPPALREFLKQYDRSVPTAGPTDFELDIPDKYLLPQSDE